MKINLNFVSLFLKEKFKNKLAKFPYTLIENKLKLKIVNISDNLEIANDVSSLSSKAIKKLKIFMMIIYLPS